MAGRARGRGASFTFDLQAIGFSRGESLPETTMQPLPLYPHIDNKAVPLLEGEEQDYLLALKQELRGNLRKLPYYIGKEAKKQRTERYTTKYEIEAQKNLCEEWTPDWRILPREMKAVKKNLKKPILPGVKKAKVVKPSSSVDVLKKIEELEKKGDDEKSDEEAPENKKKDGDEEEEEPEPEVEEEEQEEENDYIASYFEDGDDFGNSDDNMDEATY